MSKKSSTLCVTSWNKSQDLTSPAEQIEKKRKGKNEVITFFLFNYTFHELLYVDFL